MVEGQVIAERYELTDSLGSGAGTIVFRARDFLSGDETAVKVYHATALQNPVAMKSFKRDLAVLRDDTHPNVVRILDFGETVSDFYVAMELVRGAPLSREAPDWPYDTVWAIFEQLMTALAWLHSRGVVHGDIRPSNIVWNDGAITLMDFGIRRDSRQIIAHVPDCSCPYASPERLLGRALTAASDLYSAAAVIHQLVVGEPPHGVHGVAGLLKRTMADGPRIRSLAPDAPQELAKILERCLNPDPALRPASAGEIAEECRQFCSGSDGRPPEFQTQGPMLADRIRELPLDVSEVSSLLLAICRVLAAIHDAGLAHAELSPRNIRFTANGDVEIHTFPAPPPNATLMMTEPKYAAPETLLSHTSAEGAAHLRSDIYVLGFVSYEALAGRYAFRRQLFEDPDEVDTDLFWMKWHADSTTPLQPLSEVNPSVPQEVSTLIQRMIEKDPAARPCSLNDVECAIRQLQRRLEITDEIDMTSLSGTASAPAVKNAHKRKRKIPYLLLLISTLVCGVAAWWFLIPENRFGPRLRDTLNWARQKAVWARASIGDLTRKPAPTPASAALATTVETASGPMVLVPAGNFVMGSSAVPNEAPARTVHLPAFYIDKYEVSNGRYRAFTDNSGYWQPTAPTWDSDYLAKKSHPVLNVSWRDAQAFCVAVGKRLPTEAEWEKAARGSSPASRSWANWTVSGLANLKGNGLLAPAPVGAFSADVSPFGAYDMAGNVHEWVNDPYGLYTGNPGSLDHSGSAKVVRGGSFALAPPELSPSWRASLEPLISPGADSPVGFRCAADPQSPAVGSDRAGAEISQPHAQSQP